MRVSLSYLAAGLSLIVVAGCSDSTTAPQPATRQLAASAPAFDFSAGGSFGDLSSDFVLTSNGGSYSLNGLFTLNVPAGAVCNPTRSSYGAGEWDKPCSTLKSSESIPVHAQIRLTAGGLAVNFSPELRFAPGTTVTISTDIFARLLTLNRTSFASHTSALNFLAMDFSNTLGGSAVADYRLDHSLITHVDLQTGRIYRRVKHFSGYVLGNGEPCIPSPDLPDCVAVDTEQLQ